MAKRDGLSEADILSLIEESSEKISQPLLSKDHSTLINPPSLLPGETLILQQDNVTCVNTLWRAATGALHLTNYRIIFSGEFMQKYNSSVLVLDEEHLTKLGYKYQEKKTIFQNVSPSIRSLISKKSRSLKLSRKTKTEDFKWTSNKLNQQTNSLNKIEKDSIQLLHRSYVNNKSRRISLCNDNEIIISLPTLSLLDIRKFPRQYLEVERLQMLNDGIEIITTNFSSIKLCLGEEMSYDAGELLLRLLKHTKVKSSTIFAYIHKGHIKLPQSCNILQDEVASNIYNIRREAERLDICGLGEWRITDQCACKDYPTKVFLPRLLIEQGKLNHWSSFYRNNCYPLLMWRCYKTRNLLMRSSNTMHGRGDKDSRCIIDEDIIRYICNESSFSRKLTIFTESKTAICSNGCSKSPLFYPNCQVVVWDNLPSVLSTQQSSMKLYMALQKGDDIQYLKNIEDTGYLQEISILLDYSLCVVAVLNKSSSLVLLSIGSGVERAAQMSSLVQLLLDPYYRTLDGFQVLIQKEWCSISFPFKKRNLIDFSEEEELSPLFLQFLDCVWQLMQQYPLTFEYSEQLLELFAEHSYSGRFGTFLNEPENNISSTLSIWPYIRLLASSNSGTLLNYNYDKHQNTGILRPRAGIPHLDIWSWYTRFSTNKNLLVHSMFAVIELEKLQKEYQELLGRHSALLRALSKSDAESSSVSFNSRSCSSINLTESSSYCSISESDEEGDEVFTHQLSNKLESMDSSLKFDDSTSDKSMVQSDGKSSFYSPKNEGLNAINFLKEMKSKGVIEKKEPDQLQSLNEYLLSKGIEVKGSTEVVVNDMECSGYLVKKGYNYKNWKRRWFLVDLQKKYVGYYADSSANSPKGVFSYMAIRSVYRSKAKQDKYIFNVETSERTYYFRAPNEKAMNIWMMCFSVPLSYLM